MHEVNGLIVETITNGPLDENCYLVVDTPTKHAILIDPGDEADRIAKAVQKAGATVDEIVGDIAMVAISAAGMGITGN